MDKNKNGMYEVDGGVIKWFKNGLLHRVDGPAVIWPDGSTFWMKDGQLHCENGPALELADISFSNESKEWHLNGVQLSEEDFNAWLSKKQLNDRLEACLEEKPTQKKNKI